MLFAASCVYTRVRTRTRVPVHVYTRVQLVHLSAYTYICIFQYTGVNILVRTYVALEYYCSIATDQCCVHTCRYTIQQKLEICRSANIQTRQILSRNSGATSPLVKLCSNSVICDAGEFSLTPFFWQYYNFSAFFSFRQRISS